MASRRVVALLVLIAPPGGAMAAPVEVSTETPYAGITYTVWQDDAIPARIHVVSVNLSSSEIDLIATAEGQRGRTPSSFGAQVGAVVAVNGDYFSPTGYHPAGLARGQSETWSGSADDATSGFLRFHRDVVRTQVRISPPGDVVTGVPTQTVGVVGGRPLLVQGGSALTSFDCEDAIAMPCQPAPRTAIGLSDDQNRLWIVVVDGWQSGSTGMTATQIAKFLDRTLGADEALLLDGGSASALWIGGTVRSSPSDGVERAVSNHLAVRFGDLPNGIIHGRVARRSVQDGPSIPGATVTLDNGTEKIYDGDNLWSFSVRPRWACVTARADGYHPATECRQVPSADDVYASIALYPNSDFVDAAPGSPDAGPPSDAGPPPPDGGSGAGAADGSPTDDHDSAGCGCRTGGARQGPAAWILLLGLLLWARSRYARPRSSTNR